MRDNTGLFEAGGINVVLNGGGEVLLTPRQDVLNGPSLGNMDVQMYNRVAGGVLIFSSAILESVAIQRQLSLLESQGANPAVIAKSRYEAQISTIVKTGEAHPLTFWASGFIQVSDGVINSFGVNSPVNTYSQILTISDFQANPTTREIVENAIRNEPGLRDVAEGLINVCTAVGGNC